MEKAVEMKALADVIASRVASLEQIISPETLKKRRKGKVCVCVCVCVY